VHQTTIKLGEIIMIIYKRTVLLSSVSLVLFSGVAVLNAENIKYAVLDKHAYLPESKQFDISLHYNKINDAIDVLNLKKSELKSIGQSYGELGDMDGLGIKLRYSPTDNIALFASYEKDNIDYSSDTLTNDRINLFIKYNYKDIVTFDFGYIRNWTDNLAVKNEAMLNGMIKKLFPGTSTKIEDGTVYHNGIDYVLYDDDGNKIYPYIGINNAQDNSFYLTMLMAKRVSDQTILDFYIELKYTKTSSDIAIEPSNNSIIEGTFSQYNFETDLGHSEMNYIAGFNVNCSFFKSSFFEFNYEYIYSDRDKEIDYITSNHTIKAYLGTGISDNAMIYIGGQAMYRQFNNEIPYLYNQYTQTTFDHKYGYAEVGINYNF
jgi:hypothetical protein